jgi:hypothetical protein
MSAFPPTKPRFQFLLLFVLRFEMPKVKRIRAAALALSTSTRQAPLGQVIQDDENRGKYASITSRRTKRRKDDEDHVDEFFDEKTSRRILELSRDQQLEEEAEGERQQRKKDHVNPQTKPNAKEIMENSDDEDEEDFDVDADMEDHNEYVTKCKPFPIASIFSVTYGHFFILLRFFSTGWFIMITVMSQFMTMHSECRQRRKLLLHP